MLKSLHVYEDTSLLTLTVDSVYMIYDPLKVEQLSVTEDIMYKI